MSKEDETDPLFEKEVQEFGNGGHVVLPKEFIGETVQISQASETDAQSREIHPPITIEKLESVFKQSTGSDFRQVFRDEDRFPRECQYQYKYDIRLKIDVDLEYETTPAIPDHESGAIACELFEPTDEEIRQHTDWLNGDRDEYWAEVVYALEPSLDDIFDHPGVGYYDLYNYRVKWNDSVVYTTQLWNRQAKRGRFYYPNLRQFDSLSEYRSSTAYWLSTAISDAPQEDYDRYLEALELDKTVWGEKDTPLDFDRESVLEDMTLYQP